MQLLRSADVRFSSRDTVFRQSWKSSAIVAGGLLATAATLVAWAALFDGPWFIAIVGGAGTLFMGLVALTATRRARLPANWLLACDDRRLLIKVRSYLNEGDPTAPDVVELPMSDLRSARVLSVHLVAARVKHSSRSRSLELAVRPGLDLAPLAEALRRERARPVGSRARFLDQPVTFHDGSTLRLEWSSAASRIEPGLEEAVALLGHEVPVLPAHEQRFDFGEANGPELRAEAAGHLRELAARGHTLRARRIGIGMLGWTPDEVARFDEEAGRTAGRSPAPR